MVRQRFLVPPFLGSNPSAPASHKTSAACASFRLAAQLPRRGDEAEEGCLSIPGVSGVVERPTRVVVEALSDTGDPLRIEAEGLLGRCLQHEVDHLDGVLFVDRLSPLKRNMVLKRYRALVAEEQKKSEQGSAGPARSRG